MITVTLTVKEKWRAIPYEKSLEIPEHLLLSVVRDFALAYLRERAEQLLTQQET